MSENKFNTPWEIGPGSTTIITSEGFHLITNVDGMGTVTQDYETAAHIVHCVNAFEEREALLKELVSCYNEHGWKIDQLRTVTEKAKELLSKHTS